MKFKNIIISEPQAHSNFYPFSVMHSIWEIKVGIYEIWEKLIYQFNFSNLIFSGRVLQQESFLQRKKVKNKELKKGLTLVIGANVIPDKNLYDELKNTIKNYPNQSLRLTINGKIVGGIYSVVNWVENIEPDDISNIESSVWKNFSEVELKNSHSINYLWEALNLNPSQIVTEFEKISSARKSSSTKYTGVYFLKKDNVFIGNGVLIMPGVVIDASTGPVVISDNVKIMPHSMIIGPCFIGTNSIIKTGAKIYEGSSIGEHCKIGGEVEGSIIHAYSNKQHDGFLGHSYIGEWVNIGAGTNNSDLKNTYENISIQLEDELIKTDSKFIGWMCGDHSKTAIHTKINTGTVMGIAQIIACDGFPPKLLPSFSWGGRASSPTYKIDKAILTAKTVMARRGKKLLEIEEKLIRSEYERVSS